MIAVASTPDRGKTVSTTGKSTAEIRQAEPADVGAIEDVVRRAYSLYLERMAVPPGPMRDDYAGHVADANAFVLAEGNRIIGVTVLLPKADHLLLDNVAVDPDYHKAGHGRRLIEFAEAEAIRRGFDEIRLYTHVTMHENIAYYPKLGYEETHRGEQDGYARVFMRKRLVPESPGK